MPPLRQSPADALARKSNSATFIRIKPFKITRLHAHEGNVPAQEAKKEEVKEASVEAKEGAATPSIDARPQVRVCSIKRPLDTAVSFSRRLCCLLCLLTYNMSCCLFKFRNVSISCTFQAITPPEPKKGSPLKSYVQDNFVQPAKSLQQKANRPIYPGSNERSLSYLTGT